MLNFKPLMLPLGTSALQFQVTLEPDSDSVSKSARLWLTNPDLGEDDPDFWRIPIVDASFGYLTQPNVHNWLAYQGISQVLLTQTQGKGRETYEKQQITVELRTDIVDVVTPLIIPENLQGIRGFHWICRPRLKTPTAYDLYPDSTVLAAVSEPDDKSDWLDHPSGSIDFRDIPREELSTTLKQWLVLQGYGVIGVGVAEGSLPVMHAMVKSPYSTALDAP